MRGSQGRSWRAAWARWTGPRAAAARWSGAWWREQAVVVAVFGITGSSAMWLVRPLLYRHLMGLEPGAPVSGAQRALSLLYMMPFYYAILLLVGTACGRYHYVKTMVMRPVTALRRRLARSAD